MLLFLLPVIPLHELCEVRDTPRAAATAAPCQDREPETAQFTFAPRPDHWCEPASAGANVREHQRQSHMQPKNQDDLKQRQLLKEQLREQMNGAGNSTPPKAGEGLSGEGAESVLAHIRDLERKRLETPE